MTRLVLLSEFFPPDHGGIQASLGPMADALGDEVTVVAPQVHPDERHIQRSLFSGSGWPRWWWLVRWLTQARRNGMRLAIFGHFSTAVMAAALTRVPYAILISGNDLFFEQRRWPGRWFIGWLLRDAQWIGVDSHYVRRRITPYGVPLVRTWFSHPFVEHQRIRSTPHPSRGTQRILTISRLVRRKNIASLIEAIAELAQTFPHIHLDIVGDGEERSRLQRRAEELGVVSRITFHGRVDEVTKWQLLETADAFVMAPTIEQGGRDVEGFGLVYLEAAAVGLPVVASQSGGVGDAVVDGQTGLLLANPTSQAITASVAQLLTNQSIAEKLGETGRRRIEEEFTDHVRLQRLHDVLATTKARQPLVSIVIPAYQSAATIPATLHSIVNQTYAHFEIIVIDDGSTDALEAALVPWQSRLQYHRLSHGGAPRARNAGFALSQGEYVIFVDADSTLQPTMLSEMVTALNIHPEVDFIYSNFSFGWKLFRLHEFDVSALLVMNYVHTMSLLRRSAFPGFDESLLKFQDWDVWLTMVKRGSRGLWIPRQLFRLEPRQRGLGLSSWLPSFVYRLPIIGQGRGNATISKYRRAEAIIRAKHNI